MNQKADLFVDSRCELGEGPFWHPMLRRLFWFDILNQTLFSADADGQMVDRFTFKDVVSAAAVIDRDTLAVAQAGTLLRFHLPTDTSEPLVPLEDDQPANRTNDGRTNPAGGFWIGTMSRRGGQDVGAGALYQYREGEVTTILTDITIPNSICFAPDGTRAYFTDTVTNQILTCPLDPGSGLPSGPWAPFASTEGMGSPDGSVVDSEGYLWNARWGAGAVVRHAPDGSVDRVVELPVSRVTCPALGGDALKTLYITTARENMTPEEIAAEPLAGSIFAIEVDVPGQPEALLRP